MTIREIKIVNKIVIIVIVLLIIVLQCNNPIIVSPYWLFNFAFFANVQNRKINTHIENSNNN